MSACQLGNEILIFTELLNFYVSVVSDKIKQFVKWDRYTQYGVCKVYYQSRPLVVFVRCNGLHVLEFNRQ